MMRKTDDAENSSLLHLLRFADKLSSAQADSRWPVIANTKDVGVTADGTAPSSTLREKFPRHAFRAYHSSGSYA